MHKICRPFQKAGNAGDVSPLSYNQVAISERWRKKIGKGEAVQAGLR